MDKKTERSLKKYWDLLADYLKPQSGRVFLLAGLLLLTIALRLVNPQVVRFFLDQVETGGAVERLVGAAGLFMVVALIRQGIRLLVTYYGENVAWTATNMLRADLALHCLKLDMSFHKQYKPGELIERVDGDVNQLANFFSQMIINLGGNLLLMIGVIVILGLQDWRLGVGISLVAAVGFLVLFVVNKRMVPRWQALREADAGLFGYLEEWLNGMEEIRTSAGEPFILLKLYRALRARWQKVLSAYRLQVIISDMPILLFGLAYAVAYFLGDTLFSEGRMTVGEVYLIFYYLELMQGPLWESLHQIEDLQRASASINRIAELRSVQPTLVDGPGAAFPAGPLGVAFDQVTFHYEDDPESDVLRTIDFTLAPGRVLGLLGRTGSGKSTLTKLLFRFHDPSSGAIRLGNPIAANGHHPEMIDIRTARQGQLRSRIGMVTQDVQLFQATVRQNVTMFDETLPDDRIRTVIQEVGLGDWFAGLPAGLDTVLEAGGSNLSAGQAQLLAFARIFLADPGLIILDEASSRLDPATEHHIEKALDRLLVDRTGIIIAHRLETVQRADEIMILADGQIAEHGDRARLAADPRSLFARLQQTGMEEVMV